MGKSVDDIMREYGDRRSVQVGRNTDYYKLMAIYQGLFYDTQSRDAMDGAGRVILRDNRKDDRSSPLVANLVKPIVDDYVALTGILPDIKVPAPDGDQEFADMMEKYHYGVWHASNMRLQIKGMAWWNSLLGSCAALVWPDMRARHASIRFIGPDKVYGAVDMLDPFAYSSAIIVEQFSARSIRDYFPQKVVQDYLNDMDMQRIAGASRPGRLEIVRFLDKDEVVTILGREETEIRGRSRGEKKVEALRELGRATHNTGYCPLIPFYNAILPGDQRSISDVEEAIGLNQYINMLLNAHEEGVRQELFAPLILEDANKAPEDIDLSNPTEIIPLNPGGKAYRLQTSGVATQTIGAEISRTQGLVEYVTGTSQARTEGHVRSSISTGRMFEKAQGPQMTRIDVRNEINAHRLEKVNELSVLMTTAMFSGEEIQMFGVHSSKGGLFKTKIAVDDMKDYPFNQVRYSPSMYMGFENRLTAVLQMQGGGLSYRRWAIEFLGVSDHPDEFAKEIDKDKEREVAQQAALAKAAQGGQQPGGPPPLQQAVSLESGQTPKGAPAAPPPPGAQPALPSEAGGVAGGPPAQMAVPPAGTSPDIGQVSSGLGGSLADQIKSMIATLKLKGPVYMEVSGAA